MEQEYICWECFKVTKLKDLDKSVQGDLLCPKCGNDHISKTYNASNC
jgi:DNA-directed RNA polymerase subunit RPC12/RpoP